MVYYNYTGVELFLLFFLVFYIYCTLIIFITSVITCIYTSPPCSWQAEEPNMSRQTDDNNNVDTIIHHNQQRPAHRIYWCSLVLE